MIPPPPQALGPVSVCDELASRGHRPGQNHRQQTNEKAVAELVPESLEIPRLLRYELAEAFERWLGWPQIAVELRRFYFGTAFMSTASTIPGDGSQAPRWRGVDSNHQFRESRHRCPHVDFSVEAAELVDLVGDRALTFAGARTRVVEDLGGSDRGLAIIDSECPGYCGAPIPSISTR